MNHETQLQPTSGAAGSLPSGIAREARESALQVGETLIAHASLRGDSADLSEGRTGSAVILANLGRLLDRPDWIEAARRDWHVAIEGMTSQPMRAGLYSGFTGVAWGTAHLERHFFADEPTDPAEIDAALFTRLRSAGVHDFDLIGGWVGLGVYALESWPHPRAADLLRQVIARLVRDAEHDQHGAFWRTAPSLLPPHQQREAPHGYTNLGLAHGVPGVICLLAQAYRVGCLEAGGFKLFASAVEWVRKQRRPATKGLHYQSWLTGPSEGVPSRLGWCYGDLGVAVSLVTAGICAGRDDWTREGTDLAASAAQLDPERFGIKDHGLCHGAAGMAHTLNRLAAFTNDDGLRDLGVHWIRRTLDMRVPGDGVAGYTAWRAIDMTSPHEADWVYGHVVDGGYLTGAGGVALALASALVQAHPAWDRPLLLAPPPEAAP